MSKVIFDGVGEQPELNRITAKKNYASSSQSHKMGATAMFNDILHYLAKEKYPNLLNEVGGNVAVRQHPVYAFEKTLIEGTTDQYNRKFIGLYTVGADKGDKGYFGFTDARIKDKAIRLEGTDHLKGVGFNYPWEVNGVKNIRYNHDKKALCIVTGDDPTKWTALFEQSYCGTAKKEAEIEAYLEAKFKPAYDCAYYNNPLLVGTSMTLEQINADTEAFGNLRRSDSRPYSQCEFWIDGEYDVYYLNQERGVYEKNGINIIRDLGIDESSLEGLSIEEKNDIFVKARVARFKSEASKHYCIDDAIYQLMFLYIIVATDNYEKNMYPYLMDSLWRFFQDDLDSIFSTDNQGQDTKKYSAELHDFTDDRKAAYVYKGEDSALWQLIELAYPNECKKMGRDILQAMYEMATSGTTTVERLMSFFDDYFFSRAQNYFTPSAYNNDTEYAYEEAWNNKEYVASVDIHPLAQALGSHETTERAWLEKRIIYLMSKFGFGGYASASDTALGIISVRTQVAQSFTLTPAIDSYPTVLGGQGQVASADKRVMAGEAVKLQAVGGNNTNVYIVGADWLSDIGDLKDIQIDPSSNVKLSVSSKRLRRLKVGDESEEVTSYLPTLEVMRCDSLESVDARRLASLVGTVDLSQCPRLIEAFFGGTNVDGVKIAKGSKIESLQLPDSVYSLDLQDVKFLETFELGTVGNLAFLRIENVPSVNGFAILKSAYNTDGQRLKDIRLIGFTYGGDANDVTMLSNIASDMDKDGNEHAYNGIDSNGVPNTSNPELQGTLNISGGVYEEDINKVLPKFPSLTINYDPSKLYMSFADPEVLRVLLAHNVGDGTGITSEQAAAVTSISTWFNQNDKIVSFDEFAKFTSVTRIGASDQNKSNSSFAECTNLTNITLPDSLSNVKNMSFYGCTNLREVNLDKVVNIGKSAFINTPNLSIILDCPLLTTIGSGAFSGSGLTGIENLGEVTVLTGTSDQNTSNYLFYNCPITYAKIPESVSVFGRGCFYNCKSLQSINFPKGTKKIEMFAFRNCTSLQIEELNLENLEKLEQDAFYGVKIKKLVLGSDGVALTLPTGSSSTQNYGDKSVLEEVELPNTIIEIPQYSFYNYTVLKKVIAANISIIRSYAFMRCSNLRDLNLENVETIEAFALDRSGLTGDLNLPNASGDIGFRAFAETNITSVSNLGGITSLCSSTTYSTDGYGVFQNCLNLTSVTLPETLKIIGRYCFYGCTNLTSINIPQGVEEILGQAFRDIKCVDVINLPNLVKLGNMSFANSNVRRVENLGKISVIEATSANNSSKTFAYCTNLEFVRLPASLEYIGSNGSNTNTPFYGCPNLQVVVSDAVTPPTMTIANALGSNTNLVIYVPDESYEAYCESWTEYAGRIKKMSEYVEQ